MKKIILLISLGIASIHANSQMVIDIISTPQLTPMLDEIYIAGTMNDWSEGDEAYKLTQLENGHWSITLNGTNNDNLEFKFTRGTWAKVEGNASGIFIENRNAIFQNGTTLQLTIEGWEDIAGNHTVTENVRILDTDFFMPELKRTRRIWLLFPEDYDNSNLDYPVCYMHDGQNVFDAATSFSGEWSVDETMISDFVPDCASTIIVGIDNGGAFRLDEYAPWFNTQYSEGGQGEAYADFIAETLKPYIDEHFRTLPQREFTSTAGSSLGALMSMYMLIEYNDVFSRAGIFSPAFWFNPEIYDLADDQPLPVDSKVYFTCGDSESDNMVSEMQAMQNILADDGFPAENLYGGVVTGGEHNEYYWSQQFPGFVDFILSCITAAEENGAHKLFLTFPNPTSDTLNIALQSGELIKSIFLCTEDGKLIQEWNDVNAKDKSISITNIPLGYYIIRVEAFSGSISQPFNKLCGVSPVIKN